MYEGVHAYPDGDSTVARFAATAARYGYDGIVVRNHGDAQANYDAQLIEDEYGIAIGTGIEIRTTDRAQASGLIGNYRAKVDIVCVHGGQLNRFAVEQSHVDVLAHPMRDGDINHVLARTAADNGVHLEVNLGRVLRATGGQRVQAIQSLQKLQTLIDQYDVPYVVTADPSSHLQLRAPRELFAVGKTIGFDRDHITAGLTAWARLTDQNRRRRSPSYIEPGVQVDNPDDDTK